MQVQGHLSHATVFQHGILLFLVGISLVVTGNLILLLVLPIAWILSIPFSSLFLFVFPLVFGWMLGSTIGGWIGGIVGLGLMFVVCSGVTGLITAPGRNVCRR
jgi:hypothetical protein